MRRPETWGYVQFSSTPPPPRQDSINKLNAMSVRPDPSGAAKHLLHLVYYAQRGFRAAHGRFAQSLDDLGLSDLDGVQIVLSLP